jgi:DNA-binding SARP family transcriptional activator
MQFNILGSLEVGSPNHRIRITAPKQRALLVALLLSAGNEVPLEHLIRFAWDNHPPATAQTTLQSYIYRLRRLLSPLSGVELRTNTDSYLLDIDRDDTDLWFFRGQVEQARDLAGRGELDGSARHLRRGIAVWRGTSLSGVPGKTVVQEARILDGERIAAREELFDIEIALGRSRQIIPELHKIVTEHQYHEVFRAQLMLALYASGRQTEALQNYAVIRNRLRDRLGIEPGRELQELHRQILGQVPAAEILPPTWTTRVRTPIG